jgi:hypothetical protein
MKRQSCLLFLGISGTFYGSVGRLAEGIYMSFRLIGHCLDQGR